MAAVPVFHIKHCWVFVLVIFFIQRSHFHPLSRGGDNVILPGLLNPLARPETQRWEKLYKMHYTAFLGEGEAAPTSSDSAGFRPPNRNLAEPAPVPSCCPSKATLGACVWSSSAAIQINVSPSTADKPEMLWHSGQAHECCSHHVCLLPHSISETWA